MRVFLKGVYLIRFVLQSYSHGKKFLFLHECLALCASALWAEHSKALLFLADCQSSSHLAIRKTQNKRVFPTNTSFSKSFLLSFQPIWGLHHKAKGMGQ